MRLRNKIEEIREYSARKLIKLKCDLDYKKFKREGYRQQIMQRIVFDGDFDGTYEIKDNTRFLIEDWILNEQRDKYWWKSIPKF